ncbi:dnaJ domain-containing protein [Ditylenchus destructor]|uniref:DnaJ domain-containing protein n=1 Tax=Ditylenchus destructor TaxID=166010 RepID=A0AAD4MGP1_9BILA|nr:dnaJ domain-containing protein [Ditylenchus destructor]
MFQTIGNSVGCENATNLLHLLVYRYKSPKDIEEDKLKETTNKAYNKCAILMASLNTLEVGKQITKVQKIILTTKLQFVLDSLKGISPINLIANKTKELILNSLAHLDKLSAHLDKLKLTKEKKEAVKSHIVIALGFLNTEFENREENGENSSVVRKIMELALNGASQTEKTKDHLEGTYYKILELISTADDAEIKKQFRKLALKYHPDKNPGKQEEMRPKFQAISDAQKILLDQKIRLQYDRCLCWAIEKKSTVSDCNQTAKNGLKK